MPKPGLKLRSGELSKMEYLDSTLNLLNSAGVTH